MTADLQTLAFYDAESGAYAERSDAHVAAAPLDEFLSDVPAAGRILDFGCGAGWAAARFRDAGMNVTAMDGSSGMAALAQERYGLDVLVKPFADLSADSEFDGVWASFSLLHDTRAAMPGHLARLHRALRPGGSLYLGLKEGTGERRDHLGRHYTYYSKAEIAQLLTEAGFQSPRIIGYQSQGFEQIEPCLDIFAHRD